MPSFWSYIKNEKYEVGCTGQTVYIYDSTGNELARFKDLKYAYNPVLSPDGKTLVVKTAEGRMGIYDLELLKLVKKFRYSKVDAGQDYGYCFSKDGSLFYSVEHHISCVNSGISIYDTKDFECIGQYYIDNCQIEPKYIEYDEEYDSLFVLAGYRGEDGIEDHCFVAKFNGEEMQDIYKITHKEEEFYENYKHLELMGFTKKAKAWSGFQYMNPKINIDKIEEEKRPLSRLWELYHSKNKEVERFLR